MKHTLIQHKKEMFYLLSNIPENDIMESEKVLLATLKDDIELQTELNYIEYMKGE